MSLAPGALKKVTKAGQRPRKVRGDGLEQGNLGSREWLEMFVRECGVDTSDEAPSDYFQEFFASNDDDPAIGEHEEAWEGGDGPYRLTVVQKSSLV